LTPRMVQIYGLIAGISCKESGKMAPGFILDAFLQRDRYDRTHCFKL